MLTKIKESFLRAWRGEESLKTVLKIWGGSGLIVGIANLLLFIIMALSYSKQVIFEIVLFFSSIYIYLILFLIQKNLHFKSVIYNLAKYFFFIIAYILMLIPLYCAIYLFNAFIKYL